VWFRTSALAVVLPVSISSCLSVTHPPAHPPTHAAPQVQDLGGWLSPRSWMRRLLTPCGAVSAGTEALVERMLMAVMLVGGWGLELDSVGAVALCCHWLPSSLPHAAVRMIVTVKGHTKQSNIPTQAKPNTNPNPNPNPPNRCVTPSSKTASPSTRASCARPPRTHPRPMTARSCPAPRRY